MLLWQSVTKSTPPELVITYGEIFIRVSMRRSRLPVCLLSVKPCFYKSSVVLFLLRVDESSCYVLMKVFVMC